MVVEPTAAVRVADGRLSVEHSISKVETPQENLFRVGNPDVKAMAVIAFLVDGRATYMAYNGQLKAFMALLTLSVGYERVCNDSSQKCQNNSGNAHSRSTIFALRPRELRVRYRGEQSTASCHNHLCRNVKAPTND